MSEGRAGDAKSAADKYYQAATSNGWPQAYAHEAQYFQIMAQKVGGTLQGDALQGQLRNLISTLSSTSVGINTRCNVQLADSMREGGDTTGAGKIYEGIAKRDDVDDPSRAGAYLGLGHIAMAAATPAEKDGYYDAMLYFLRVYVETKNAHHGQVGEALENAATCAEQWGGEGSSRIKGLLKFIHSEKYAK